MNNAEKHNYVLTPEECDYIEKLILKNECIVRSVLKSALYEKFEQIGEECISDLYLLMCKKIDKLKQHENPDGWVIVATKMIASNAVRKYNTELKRTADKETKDIPVQDDFFESALYEMWLKDGIIDKLFDKLTPHEREIYNYLYQKRLSAKKVAEIMGVSESTIRNIKAHIKKKIKKYLKESTP